MQKYPDKIFLIGFMGVGKSYWGSRLSNALNYPFIDLDSEVSRAAGGRTITEIFEQSGEEHFRSVESEILRKYTTSASSFVMACGGGTPCFLNNLDLMKSVGLTLWLQADPVELLGRLLAEKDKRPLLKNLSADQLESYILRKLADRRLYYQQAHRSVWESQLQEHQLLEQLFL